MYRSILITGGAGFVGSSLALDIRARRPDTRILAFDNLHRRGSELNLPRLRKAGVEFIHGDIRCAEDLATLPVAPEAILECSAEPSVLAGYSGSPDYLVETNLMGCYRCLELARITRADFLFISTSRVYPVASLNSLSYREDPSRFTLLESQSLPGASEEGISEVFPLNGARSLYGMTKLAAELMVAEYGDAFGLRTTINRCGLLAGPWQMGKSDQGAMALWVAAHHFGLPLQYIGFGGAGKQVRDVLHIADFCDLVAMQLGDINRFSGKLFNVGGGLRSSVSLQELTRLCQTATGKQIPVGSHPGNRQADLISYITDNGHITGFCGWRPKRTAENVVDDIAKWIREEERLVRPVFAPASAK